MGVALTPLHRRRVLHGITAATVVVLLAGCATAPQPPAVPAPVFYPAPPEQPRIQYLTSISGSGDVTAPRSVVLRFLLGPEPNRPIVKPYGIGFWQDRIYVCDSQLSALEVMDLKARTFTYLAPFGRLAKPINLAIDDDGTKYVADTVKGVVIFDAQDRWVGQLEGAPDLKASDVAIAGDRIYVSDLATSQVTVWDKATRKWIGEVPLTEQKKGQPKLLAPVNLAVDPQGSLYVSDFGACKVLKFGKSGAFVRSFGSPGDQPGQFARPKGLDVADDGELFVADAASEVVQVFNPAGTLLLYFGEPRPDGPSLTLPASVRVNRSLLPYFSKYADPGFPLDYLVFVSSQYGEHKISVFGVGK